MPQHSYKQLEEAYQRGVNKDHKPNPARTHPMSSQQGKGHQEMPITQTEQAQYSHDSQSDSDQDFDVMTVNPNTESTQMDGTHSHPQDGHTSHHVRLKADNMDQHLATYRDHTSDIATVLPAEKTKLGTSEMN